MYEANSIDIAFWTELSVKEKKIGKEIIDIFFQQYTDFIPLYWYGGKFEKAKVGAETPDMILETLLDNTKVNGFLQNTTFTLTNEGGRKKNSYDFSIVFGVDHKLNSHFSFSVSYTYLNTKERILTFIKIANSIFDVLKPFYGRIHDIGDSVETRKRGQTLDVYNKIPRIYWCNYIGEMYLQKIGDRKLASFEAYRNEQVGEGRFIQLTESPFDFETKQFIKKQKELEKIIGKKLIGYNEVDLKNMFGK